MTFRTKPEALRLKRGDEIEDWTILGNAFSIGRDSQGCAVWAFVCRCSCGTLQVVRSRDLKNKKSLRCRPCGCLIIGSKNATHGEAGNKLYGIWKEMHKRCYDETNPAYERYGGRGIVVYEEWQDLHTFIFWAGENGYKEGYDLHRLDNDFGYGMSNCIWLLRTNHRHLKHERRITYEC